MLSPAPSKMTPSTLMAAPDQLAATSALHATANDISAAMQTEVVFIDPSVADYQTLIEGLPSGTQDVVLDARTDGLAQIAQYLQAHQGVEAISLISHGGDGAIQVGSSWLTNGDLSGYSTQLTQIGTAMNAGGDFLIYGCDVAQEADGQALVRKIADITNLNVAASTDATGSAALGGNWTLEYQVGDVHTVLNVSASAQAQFNGLLGVTTETYDQAAQGNFQAVGQSRFTLDGIVYTLDQPANSYAYNDSNSPNGPTDITDGPTDGVLEVNADGASTMHNLNISLANGHNFSLQNFDLSSFNGDLYVQAAYANGSHSAMIQLATAQVGGFTGTVSNQSQLGTAFNNIASFSLIDQNDTGSFEPTLDNLAYIDNSPSVATSSGNASWISSDNGVGGTAVAVDPGITLSDPNSASASTATVRIANVQTGDQLSFVAQNGITGSYNGATGILLLTGSGSPSLASWQAALQSITFFSTQTSPNLSTNTRTVSFAFNDGTMASNVATRAIAITATDQTPLVTEGGPASTSYIAGTAAVAVDANLHVSDADTPKLASGAVTIASGYASGDTLAFHNSNSTLYGDISGTFDAGTQKLTLTSATNNATVAQWQNAYEAVTFSSATGTTGGTRDITFAVSDGTKTSAPLHHSVAVTTGPTVSTDSGSAQFVSGDNTTSTPVAVDPGILLADDNSTTLVGATVSITGNLQSNHDELVFIGNPATMGNISGVYDSGPGVLTLTASGGASLLQWQNALASVRFTNDLAVPSSNTRTVSFQTNDGTLTSPVATRTVAVTATDQTPVLGGGGNTAAFVSGDNTPSTAVVVNNAITVGDLDGGPLQQAVIAITGHYEASDVLAFNNNNAALYGNLSAVYTNGTLTLTSSGNQATLAQWQNALQSVTYNSTAVTPGTLARTVSFAVGDGTKTSAAVASTVTVADTDQTPVIAGSSGSLTFTQGDNVSATPVVIDSGITVSDRDNATLTQANIVIGSGYDSNGDALLFTNDSSTMGNIAGSYSSGVLALTSSNGSATVAQWQAALRSIQFTDSAATPSTTQRVISFLTTDGIKVSSGFQRTINVSLTDQTPLVTTSGGTTAFTAGDNGPSTPVLVDRNVTVTKADSAALSSATVAITGNFQASQDVLGFTNDGATEGNITGSYNAATGVLTLSSAGSTASVAQFQAALEAVTYTNTAVTPATPNRSITFSATDVAGQTGTSTAGTITVAATDQTPVVLTSGGTTAAYTGGNSPVVVDTGVQVSDIDNVSLSSTTATITNAQAGDVLGFTNNSMTQGNIAGSYNAATGVLTLSSAGSTASVAQFQAALEAVTFSTASATPDTTTRTISFAASDGTKTGTATQADRVTVAQAPQSGGGGSSSPSTTPSSGPDLLTGTGSADVIAGQAGNDTIDGGDGNSLLFGNQGDDVISAGDGNSTIAGGMDNDRVTVGNGSNLLYGNEGADTIQAGNGNNTVVGGQGPTDGADLIATGSGNDLILGNGGDDSVSAGGGRDIVVGGFGRDLLLGNQGDDILLGNQGDDALSGGQGNDTLYGGQGNDVLWGNQGDDVLYGSEGLNTFGFNPGDTVFRSGLGTGDTIVDFHTGTSRLDFASGPAGTAANFGSTSTTSTDFASIQTLAQGLINGGKTYAFVADGLDGFLFTTGGSGTTITDAVKLAGAGSSGAVNYGDIAHGALA